jgi:NADH/NAD ratio-sensing transcriptional regulator Rex
MTENISISTKELASLFRVDSQTIRRGFCVNGHYMGLKPLKLPNRRLLWNSSEVRKILENRNA